MSSFQGTEGIGMTASLHRAAPRRAALLCLAGLLVTVFAGCSSFTPRRLDVPAELHNTQLRKLGDVTVTVAVLTDGESARHFGVPLGEHGVQALWLSVRNASTRRLWFIRNSLDPDFYSAEEVGQLVSDDVPGNARPVLSQLLRDESMRSMLQPRTITEGFVYLPRAEGGRYLDIRLQGDAYVEDEGTAGQTAPPERPLRELRFEFAFPLPDGDFDYERLDSAKNYPGQVLPDLDAAQLRTALEQLRCCATDADGGREGDPLNIVLVGEAEQVLNSLSRSGWSFTHRLSLRTIRREIGAVIAGDAYPVAPVSSLYAFGRRQDLALQRARQSIARRNHMRLWQAPFRFEGRPVWIGQVSRDIGIKLTTLSPTLTTHVIDPEVDTTREYLLHSLVAEGFVDRYGFVRGSAAASRTSPRVNLTEDPYFSDGMRLVVILSPEPVSSESIRSLHWEQSAAPIAEGQSEAARRYIRALPDGD